MDKKELIIKAMQELLLEDKGASCSVSDIAKKAGIGKGSIYYYYKSKEEIFDDVVDRIYGEKIKRCQKIISGSDLNAIGKMELLFRSYGESIVDPSIDSYLHTEHNAAIHQKSLAKLLILISPLVEDIFRQGVREKLFVCDNPKETSEIFVSVLCFLFDHGIFNWTQEELQQKIITLADIFEKSLSAPKGSFKFLYQR